MTRQLRSTTIAIAMTLFAAAASAHGPVARKAETLGSQARLFTADSSTGQVVAVDLPAGNVVARLATPPYVLGLGLSHDRRHVFALRGRDTDRDTITVIDTGLEGDVVRFPVIARTFTGDAPGGIREGFMPVVGGKTALFNEGAGAALIFDSADFGALGPVQTRTLKFLAPDHYHYQEAGGFSYVGHLAKGLVQILSLETGQEVGRIGNCRTLHGMCQDEVSGRVLFACQDGVLVIGTRGEEQNREVARIPYPGQARIGVFLHGKDRVVWGTTEGANPAIQRLDLGREPYTFESIPVESVIQRGASDDGRFLMLYSRSGVLDIRDGGTGELLHQLRISKPFTKEYHEHVDKALLPDIVALGDRGYVTVPPEGVIVELDLPAGRILRRIEVGGEPTRLVAVEAKTVRAASNR